MLQHSGNPFSHKPPRKSGPTLPKIPSGAVTPALPAAERPQTYTKVFRWRLPKGRTHEPKTIEVVGTFTQWEKVPLIRDNVQDAWHVTLHDIPCNRMHHYMLLVDGQPAGDKHCDGLAVPHGPQEQQYQLMTARGPRVLMLFAQTK